MIDDSTQLRNRIIRLSDKELIRIVEVNHSQYREEALVYAHAELQRRGLRSLVVEEPDVAEPPSLFSSDLETEERDERAKTNSTPKQSAEFRVFHGRVGSREEMMKQAAEYASRLGPERVISISHTADEEGEEVVTVWY